MIICFIVSVASEEHILRLKSGGLSVLTQSSGNSRESRISKSLPGFCTICAETDRKTNNWDVRTTEEDVGKFTFIRCRHFNKLIYSIWAFRLEDDLRGSDDKGTFITLLTTANLLNLWSICSHTFVKVTYE